MAGYMPEEVFEAGAYAIASIHVGKSVSLGQTVDIVYDQYKASYEDDNIREQWACSAETVINGIASQFTDLTGAELADLLEYLVNVVMAHEPSGAKRKKKFFGGTFFNKTKSPNYRRKEIVESNFPSYFSQLNKAHVRQITGHTVQYKKARRTDARLSREAAVRLMEAGRFSNALEILLKLRRNEPDSNLFYLIGQCYRYLDDLDNAALWLENAEATSDPNSQVLLGLGIVYQLQGRFEEATAALTTAIDLEPTNFAAYNSLGLTYRIQGRLKEALAWYEKAAERIVWTGCEALKSSFTREAKVNGERTLQIMAGYDDALLEFLRSSPLYAIVQNNIGICLAEMGQSDVARERFSESIRTTPPGYDYAAPREALRMLNSEY